MQRPPPPPPSQKERALTAPLLLLPVLRPCPLPLNNVPSIGASVTGRNANLSTNFHPLLPLFFFMPMWHKKCMRTHCFSWQPPRGSRFVVCFRLGCAQKKPYDFSRAPYACPWWCFLPSMIVQCLFPFRDGDGGARKRTSKKAKKVCLRLLLITKVTI